MRAVAPDCGVVRDGDSSNATSGGINCRRDGGKGVLGEKMCIEIGLRSVTVVGVMSSGELVGLFGIAPIGL